MQVLQSCASNCYGRLAYEEETHDELLHMEVIPGAGAGLPAISLLAGTVKSVSSYIYKRVTNQSLGSMKADF